MITRTATDRHEFRFGLGHPVLEFLATHAGRRGEPLERLATPDDLTRWLALSRLAEGARCDVALLADAHELREAIYRVLAAGAAVDADLVGVDLMPDDAGGYSIVELNGAADFTDLYGEQIFTRVADLLAPAPTRLPLPQTGLPLTAAPATGGMETTPPR